MSAERRKIMKNQRMRRYASDENEQKNEKEEENSWEIEKKRYKNVPTLLKLSGESNNANSDSKYESKRRSILKYRKSASCSVNA